MEAVELGCRRILVAGRRLVYEGECFVKGSAQPYRMFSILKDGDAVGFDFYGHELGPRYSTMFVSPVSLSVNASDLVFSENQLMSRVFGIDLGMISYRDMNVIADAVDKFLRKESTSR